MKRMIAAIGFVAITQAACLGGPSLIKERPADYLEANAPSQVWATMLDGDHLVINGPRVISDTIFGWADNEEIMIPVEDVKEVRVRQLSIWRSALIPASVVGLGVAGVLLVTAPQGDAPVDQSQLCEDTSGICPDDDPSMMP